MKRIQEKVKDLVEVRVQQNLQDFAQDPPQTLSAYHFTDATSAMMAIWLDKIVEVEARSGAAKALAGYRGVGKSHFLATLGAIVAHPELRSRISDAHVAASAQRLKRRRYPVAIVRRGTHPTLLEEIKDAIGAAFEVDVSVLGDSASSLLNFAAEKAADLPFILIVDTAFDRAARVARDDGVLLGEIAEIAKNSNIFVAVALDDDIAGADGMNAAIARNFTIDYLDQEHLYRIVETHLFPKYRQTQHLLHDIYTHFREVMPNFSWSEQRFAALYPLHPVILENAPFVRLYAPDFAFLSFASEAGSKVLGRPANSLVALDEVFDRVENSLRKAPDLQDAFETYDRLNADVLAHIPVMQRLQAKLALKGLLLLSLDGDGTTASEISAAMLIYDENEPSKTIALIEDLLETFVSVFPDQVRRAAAADGRETRFSLKISSKDDLNNELANAALTVSNDEIEKVLRRFARERFSDWTLPAAAAAEEGETAAAAAVVSVDTTDCQITWRGGFRRGRLIWNWQADDGDVTVSENAPDFLDWEVIVNAPNALPAKHENSSLPTVFWQPAALRIDEEETLRRYYILLTDTDLRETYGEQIRAAGHAHHASVEKIWNRVFLEDARLVIDDLQYPFTEKARNASNLCALLSEMLIPLFDIRYPGHPFFARTLGMNEVAQLVSEHFSSAKAVLPEVQELAATFALPLGLVVLHGNNYILNSDEKQPSQPFINEIMSLAGENKDETVALKTIYHELKKEPYGLVREAAHLVLAALVAQRRLEFVTSNGDRINRRSLDLKIIWDDIVGVATPATVLYSSAELTDWARTLTAGNFKTIDDPDDRENIRLALQNWFADWKSARVLERFDELPDEILNTKIWNLATRARKTFGAVAVTVETVLDESIALEEGLQRIADAFSDSEKEFYASTKNLVTLEDFINGVPVGKKAWEYVAVCETTDDEAIEDLREKLLAIIKEMAVRPGEDLNQELDKVWRLFHARFSEHFAVNHDTIMKSHLLQEQFEEIMRGDEWWEFENLSALPIFQKNHWRRAQNLRRRLDELNCGFEAREMLETNPFCGCSFRLSEISEWEKLPAALLETVNRGRQSYRRTLSILSQMLASEFESLAQNESSIEFAAAAAHLSQIFGGGGGGGQELPLLSNTELIVLKKAAHLIPKSSELQIALPTEIGFANRAELSRQVNQWLDELPDGETVSISVR